VSGLPSPPSAYCILLYVLDADGFGWWSKPMPYACAPVAADGAFAIAWASSARTDRGVLAFQLYAVPIAGGATPPRLAVLGGALPSASAAGALAALTFARGYFSPTAANDTSSATTGGGGAGAGGDIAAPALTEALTGSLIAVSTILGALLVSGLAVGGYAAWLHKRRRGDDGDDGDDDGASVVRRTSAHVEPPPPPLPAPAPPAPPPPQASAALPPRHRTAPTPTPLLVAADWDGPAGDVPGQAAAAAAAGGIAGAGRRKRRYKGAGREAFASPARATPSAAAVAVASPHG